MDINLMLYSWASLDLDTWIKTVNFQYGSDYSDMLLLHTP